MSTDKGPLIRLKSTVNSHVSQKAVQPAPPAQTKRSQDRRLCRTLTRSRQGTGFPAGGGTFAIFDGEELERKNH